MRRGMVLSAGLAGLIGPSARAQVAPPANASCVAADTTVQWVRWPTADSAPTRATLDSLEGVLGSAPASRTAELLFQLGRAKSYLVVDSAYAKARPSEFFYNEIAGSWLYSGWHFDELLRRFPQSDLADDAAFERTLLPQGGECEGFTACYVGSVWLRVEPFLREYPSSPLAEGALRRALLAFSILKDDMDLVNASEYIELDEVGKLVASLDSVARLQRPAIRAPMLARAGELWEQMGRLPLARGAYASVIELNDRSLAPCVAARLAALPTAVLSVEAPRVIHAKRVELNWRRIDTVAAYLVRRAASRTGDATVLARLPATTVGWTDTSTVPGTTYWYTIAAEGRGAPVSSFPMRADVPSWKLRLRSAAVSLTDGRLYVMGNLANGFPQLLRVSPDGRQVERIVAAPLSERNNEMPASFMPHVRERVVASSNGIGVLSFPANGREVPAALRAAVRSGAQLLDTSSRRTMEILASVDERGRQIALERGGGGSRAFTAIDCLAADSLCWLGGEMGLILRDRGGRELARATLKKLEESMVYPAAVFADPLDGSVWAFLQQQRRLVHVDRSGIVRHELSLGGDRTWVASLTVDFKAQVISFARQQSTSEIVRIDMKSGDLRQQVLATVVPRVRRLLPDGNGGLWLVGADGVRRMDAQGRVSAVEGLTEVFLP